MSNISLVTIDFIKIKENINIDDAKKILNFSELESINGLSTFIPVINKTADEVWEGYKHNFSCQVKDDSFIYRILAKLEKTSSSWYNDLRHLIYTLNEDCSQIGRMCSDFDFYPINDEFVSHPTVMVYACILSEICEGFAYVTETDDSSVYQIRIDGKTGYISKMIGFYPNKDVDYIDENIKKAVDEFLSSIDNLEPNDIISYLISKENN